MNIVCDIRDKLGFDSERIKQGILQHIQGPQDRGITIDYWFFDANSIPAWAKQAATRWVLEMWLEERDSCEPNRLLAVDKKYTHILRGYSMAEIIGFRNSLEPQ